MWPSKVLGEPMATETKILDQKLEEGWKILQCTCPCDMMSLTVSTRRRHSFEALIKLYCYSATNSVSFKIFKATVSYVVLLCERKYRSFWVLCLQWLSLLWFTAVNKLSLWESSMKLWSDKKGRQFEAQIHRAQKLEPSHTVRKKNPISKCGHGFLHPPFSAERRELWRCHSDVEPSWRNSRRNTEIFDRRWVCLEPFSTSLTDSKPQCSSKCMTHSELCTLNNTIVKVPVVYNKI